MRLTIVESGIVISRSIPLSTLPSFNLEFDNGIGFVSYTDEETNETKDNREEAIQAEINGNDDTNYDILNQAG